MNIFSGMLSSTSDCNLAIHCSMSGWKVLYIGDPCGEEKLINQYKFILAIPLVPSYEILIKDVDGYHGEFNIEYEEMLSNEPARNFFLGILTAMFNGINVLLYFPNNVVSDFIYPSSLLNYIYTHFGIIASSDTNAQFIYDDNYNADNLKFMYVFDTIDFRTFLMFYNYNYDTHIIDKLVCEIRPKLNNMNDYNEKLSKIIEYRSNLFDFASKNINPVDVVYHSYGGAY